MRNSDLKKLLDQYPDDAIIHVANDGKIWRASAFNGCIVLREGDEHKATRVTLKGEIER